MSKINIKNINLKKLKSLKKPKLTKRRIGVVVSTLIFMGVASPIIFTSCGKDETKTVIETEYDSTATPTPAPSVTATPAPSVTATPAPTATPVPTETPVQEVVITELGVEEFNELVATIEAANKEAGLNLRKENLELVLYINNHNIVTPELARQIESRYNYKKDDMMNNYLKVMNDYSNDLYDYYNGEDTKYADISLLFLDKIDRETSKYLYSLGAKIYNCSAYTEGKTEETMAAEKVEVEKVIKEIQGYMLGNDTINGYTRFQLTSGGFFGNKLLGDDIAAIASQTGYGIGYESIIADINEANIEAGISGVYSMLGSKSLAECEEKVITK